MARPRIKDVAQRAGVSEKTVSNVINDYAHVSERTRAVVRQAIDELGYRINLAGRHLRRGRTGIIALVLPELDFTYFGELARHVISEAERRSLTVLVHQTLADRQHELTALDGFGSDFADGLIMSPLALTAEDVRDRDGTLPVVLLGELIQEGADHVAIDNVLAAREATEHLIGLGRRSIATVGGRYLSGGDVPTTGTALIRSRGHREALRAAGLPYDPGRVIAVRQFRTPDGAAAVDRHLDEGHRPDALLCLNDQMALGALRALHRRGVRVPEDVAVVGFDDIEAGRFSVPSLTTVSPDKAEVARVAVELLVRRIEERADGSPPSDGRTTPQNHVVPHHLVVRESTAGRGT
ncbi:LacI family DNA-binding transcriptional regulator [Streptomyces sp. SBT349]|uniref:LacI family DNA-binding transcriptional regulator n=1 Tax=Streptomyces sp. SBT349 TaxID=1580539 RepID=UPI00066DB9E9|nr:LacI family DNA-binding transcriptional regulator [Streptomyces sp. SBT349]